MLQTHKYALQKEFVLLRIDALVFLAMKETSVKFTLALANLNVFLEFVLEEGDVWHPIFAAAIQAGLALIAAYLYASTYQQHHQMCAVAEGFVSVIILVRVTKLK